MYTHEEIEKKLKDYRGLRRKARVCEHEAEHIEYIVGLLEPDRAAALRLLYFDGLTWKQAQDKLAVSGNTLFRYRQDAVSELVAMYSEV